MKLDLDTFGKPAVPKSLEYDAQPPARKRRPLSLTPLDKLSRFTRQNGARSEMNPYPQQLEDWNKPCIDTGMMSRCGTLKLVFTSFGFVALVLGMAWCAPSMTGRIGFTSRVAMDDRCGIMVQELDQACPGHRDLDTLATPSVH
jgi:hypothetical protein